MTQTHWQRRDAKVARRTTGMRISARSTFVIQRIRRERDARLIALREGRKES